MNFFSKKNNGFWGTLAVLSLVACHDKEALKQALIDQTVQEKIKNHIRKKKATCRREYMKEALILADSLMIKLALSKVDTNSRISRPTKPIRPEVDLPTDTTPIQPLFKDTIGQEIDTFMVEDTIGSQALDTTSTL